jgi:DNA-directed RNA polymerase specialized sigma subunit
MFAKSKREREIVRGPKRYDAREVFRRLVDPEKVINDAELHQLRNQHDFTLTYIALTLGTSTSKVSNIVKSIYHDCAFTERYLEWLNEAGSSGAQKAA